MRAISKVVHNYSAFCMGDFHLLYYRNGCLEAQIVYAVICLYVMVSSFNAYKDRTPLAKYRLSCDIHTGFTLMILVLARPHNLILVAMMIIQEHVVQKYIWYSLQLSVSEWTLYFLWMGQAAFFYQV